MSRVSRRASAEDTCKPTHSVEEGEENRHQYVRSSVEPTEHTQQQETNDEKKPKSRANSGQEKSKANRRQKKSKNTCEKPKAEHEESMKHTPRIYTSSTRSTRNSPRIH